MKKNLLLIIATFLLIGCDNLYTTKEIEYLSDIKNYQEYDVQFAYVKSLNETISSDTDISFYVTFNSYEDLNLFSSTKIEAPSPLEAYKIPFFTPKLNSIILRNNQFYLEIVENDSLTIRVSNYTSVNNTFYYLLSVKTETKTYLDENDSINNIKAYLKEKESPFFK